MEFQLTDEQRLLRDTVQRFAANECDFETRRQLAPAARLAFHEVWPQLAELGLLGLSIPEAYGGFGAGAVETMLVSEALGGALFHGP